MCSSTTGSFKRYVLYSCLILSCCVVCDTLQGLKQEQMEQVLDRFDARQELSKDHVILNQGDLVRSYPASLLWCCHSACVAGACTIWGVC